MDCSEAKDLFSPILDGEAAPEVRQAFEKHLAACPDCREAFAQFSRLSELYAGLPPVNAPHGFSARMGRALDAVEAEEAEEAKGVGGAREDRKLWRGPGGAGDRGRRAGVWGPRAFALAAAAVLVAGFGVIAVLSLPDVDRTMLSKAELAQEAASAEGKGKPVEARRGSEPKLGRNALREEPAETDAPVAEVREAPAPAPPPPSAPPPVPAPEPAFQAAPAPTTTTAPPPPAPPRMDETRSTSAPPPSLLEGRAVPESAPPVPQERRTRGRALAPLGRVTVGAPPDVQSEAAREEAGAPPAPERLEAGDVQAEEAVPILGSKEAAPAPAEGLPRAVVQDRVFVREGEVWRQEEYAGETAQVLLRDSTFYRKLVAEHPELRRVAALGPVVIFEVRGRWYRLTRGETASPVE